jgi:amino acid transporter
MTEQPLATADNHGLHRQLRLRDLVLAQVLTVVGSSWVGIAAGLGSGEFVAWIAAFVFFYAPMAVAVYFLNREMPLEGGLYVWAKRAFGDAIGFMVAFNIWAYALSSIATILFQIPSEMAFMIGPRAAALPDNHKLVYIILAIILALLTWTALRGLGLGKWIHNISGAAMIAAFVLLIAAPLWALAHGAHLHWNPAPMHLPAHDLMSLSLFGQVLFAAAGLEYIAIMAGETHGASRTISLSVVVATPIVFLMFTLGTASVTTFHGLHPQTAINYVAPIPQTLSQAFGEHGPAAWVAKLTIFLLQIRIIGAASFLFTGATRLPMAAGWDYLIPAWFARLNSRRIPANSILLTGAVVGALLVLGSIGVHAAEAFAVLNDASSEFYALAYLAMFLIPILGARELRKRMPTWAAIVCISGVLTTIFCLLFNAYPFVGVDDPKAFAIKILGTTIGVNALAYLFYALRSRRNQQTSNSLNELN